MQPNPTLRIYMLLGGFFPGPDGYVTSAGFHLLRAQLAHAFPHAVIQTYQWSSYHAVGDDIAAHPGDRIVVIGYSGGGSRFTMLANDYHSRHIDLAVLYDPSPSWQMEHIWHGNVDRIVAYENAAPFFFGLGGGEVTAAKPTQVVVVPISMNHIAVQFNQNLHNRTVQEIADLVRRTEHAH